MTESVTSIKSEIATQYGDDEWMHNLHAKPLGPFTYAVLSARNGSVTSHTVDLKEPSCTCEDKKFNLGPGPGACAHIAYANLREDDGEERDAALLQFIAYASSDLSEQANRLERAATGHEADRAAAGGEDTTEPEAGDDPESRAREWLEAHNGEPLSDDVEIWIHEEFGSVNIDPNYELTDDGFDGMMADLRAADNAWFDESTGTAVIKPDGFDEVFG